MLSSSQRVSAEDEAGSDEYLLWRTLRGTNHTVTCCIHLYCCCASRKMPKFDRQLLLGRKEALRRTDHQSCERMTSSAGSRLCTWTLLYPLPSSKSCSAPCQTDSFPYRSFLHPLARFLPLLATNPSSPSELHWSLLRLRFWLLLGILFPNPDCLIQSLFRTATKEDGYSKMHLKLTFSELSSWKCDLQI